jgi:hypothetical protein
MIRPAHVQGTRALFLASREERSLFLVSLVLVSLIVYGLITIRLQHSAALAMGDLHKKSQRLRKVDTHSDFLM